MLDDLRYVPELQPVLPFHETFKKPFDAVALRSFTLDPDGMTTMTAYDVLGPLRRFKFAVVVSDCPAVKSEDAVAVESSAAPSGPSPSSPTSPTPLDDPFGSTAEQPIVVSTAATARAAKRMVCA